MSAGAADTSVTWVGHALALEALGDGVRHPFGVAEHRLEDHQGLRLT